MKTNECVKKLEAIGFNVCEGEGTLYVVTKEGAYLASVSTDALYMLDTEYPSTYELCEDKRHRLFITLTEYSQTPIEEREEEKKLR